MTDEQRANLRKLADYLYKGKTAMRFDMSRYCVNEYGNTVPINIAHKGACGCAIGHGPAAGIEPKDGHTWLSYTYDSFGFGPISREFSWLFFQSWAQIDNTPKGAAQRIYYFLKHGVPETCNEQMYLGYPLCYVNEGPEQ